MWKKEVLEKGNSQIHVTAFEDSALARWRHSTEPTNTSNVKVTDERDEIR